MNREYRVVCDNGHRGTIDADAYDVAPYAILYVCPICGLKNPLWDTDDSPDVPNVPKETL